MVQVNHKLTDDGGRMIAEGLKGNCSVVEVVLVSAGLLLVRLLLLTCVDQGGNYDISDAVMREITQGLQERHGADKGVAVGASCSFFDFDTCEFIDFYDSHVRLLSLDDVARRAMASCAPRLPTPSSPPARPLTCSSHR